MRDKQLQGAKGRMMNRGELRPSAYLRRCFAALPGCHLLRTREAQGAFGSASWRLLLAREKLDLLLPRSHLLVTEFFREPDPVDCRAFSVTSRRVSEPCRYSLAARRRKPPSHRCSCEAQTPKPGCRSKTHGDHPGRSTRRAGQSAADSYDRRGTPAVHSFPGASCR